MKPKTSSPFDLKRSNGRLTGLAYLVLGCSHINLASPWFIVSTKVENEHVGVFDQQFLSWDAENLSKLLDVLEDKKEERRVYVVSAHNPSNGMKIDRLREVWRASDANHPSIATLIYILDDGNQFIRQIDCTKPGESLGESRLLVRV